MRSLIHVSILALALTGFAFGGESNNGNHYGQDSNQGQNNACNRSVQSESDVHAAPEINPSEAVSALALLSGAVLVIRRKK